MKFVVSSTELLNHLTAISRVISSKSTLPILDNFLFNLEENRLLDVLENDEMPAPDKSLMTESLKDEVNRALSSLPEREAEVVRLYFGLNEDHSLTLEEIGERFNLTRERVRQIKEKAIRRLRNTTRSKNLKAYLG